MKKTKIFIRYSHREDEIGTEFFNIEGLSNWDLESLWRLLKAEENRAKIVNGFNRGIKELRERLDELAYGRGWRIN